MTAVLRNSVFVHISKTGGTWVTQALRAAGLLQPTYVHKHYNVEEIKRAHPELADMQYFAFLRNPVTWWQSRWSCNFNRRFFLNQAYRPYASAGSRQLVRYNSIMNKQEFDDFNVWAYRVLRKRPDFVSRHYRLYLGENYDKAQHLGRYESLSEDLPAILAAVGERFRAADLTAPASNAGEPSLDRRWDKRLLRGVLSAEREFMARFGYSTSPADYRELCE